MAFILRLFFNTFAFANVCLCRAGLPTSSWWLKRSSLTNDPCLQDAFKEVTALGKDIKRGFKVTFTDVHGILEAGIDGGGLFKDFMENLVKEGFDPQLGLFLATEDNRLYPNPNARVAMDSALSALEFLGKIVGLTIYEVRGTPVWKNSLSQSLYAPSYRIPL